jgi:hypothetical protein
MGIDSETYLYDCEGLTFGLRATIEVNQITRTRCQKDTGPHPMFGKFKPGLVTSESLG